MPASASNDFDVPPGLTELLQEFTVAVLRGQPTDLLRFAKEFFDSKYSSVAPDGDDNDGRCDSIVLTIIIFYLFICERLLYINIIVL